MMLHNCILHLQELAEPSIRDAFQSCVEQGAHRIIVSPFFLSPGRHWTQVSLHRILSYFSINCQNDSDLMKIENSKKKLNSTIMQDIPSLSAEAAKEHPDVSYIVTAPLGLHELLVV